MSRLRYLEGELSRMLELGLFPTVEIPISTIRMFHERRLAKYHRSWFKRLRQKPHINESGQQLYLLMNAALTFTIVQHRNTTFPTDLLEVLRRRIRRSCKRQGDQHCEVASKLTYDILRSVESMTNAYRVERVD